MPDIEPAPLLVERDGHIQILTLNRPAARNAVNLALAVALGEALDAAENDREVWVVIVTGSGDKAFCAGADLKAISRGEAITPTDPHQAAWGFAGFTSHHISKPVIAAVNGFALGGGTEIALAADLVVAIDTATFGLPEVGKGIYAGAGGVFRLPAQVPKKIAMEMMLTGEPITAQRALELGLVNQVVPADQLLQAAKGLAERICANAPLAVQASKRIAGGIVNGKVASERDAWELSTREGMALMGTADAQEGPLAFSEKRAPEVERAMTERAPVIAGLGITEMGKVYGRTAAQFAGDAVRLAARDAGLGLADVDGLLISSGVTGGVSLALQRDLGLTDLALLSEMQAYGSTAGGMVSFAAMAVQSGLATVVACVFADDPLKPGGTAGSAYGTARIPAGWGGLLGASGVVGANSMYAMAARRHMETFGTTSEQFGHIAVAQRAWAAMNDRAQMREPITLEDHQQSRWVAEPLHLLDCCLVSNGGVAVIVTSAERANDLAQPSVPILGWAQSHPGHFLRSSPDFGLVTGAVKSGPKALAMAGVELADIDVVELYDCYTYTVLISLEDYGFCAKGEGGAFVESGVLGPHGSLKLNTGGGQLSSYYQWGMTPLSEGIIQARGQAGDRQVVDHNLVLVSGNGGVLDHHSTLVLGGGESS